MRRSAAQPLTLSEQLDAMLHGWLERHATTRGPERADITATAVVNVAVTAVAEVERFCRKWHLTVEQRPRGGASWAVLYVTGPLRPIEGLTAITAMYRP